MFEFAAAGRRRRSFERRIVVLLLILALLSLASGIGLASLLPLHPALRGALILLLAGAVVVVCVYLFKAVVEPLRGLTNVVGAYRDGDYTVRCNREFPGDALGDLAREINELGNTLLRQRLRAMEATALVEKLIAAIEVAVLAFDGEGQLRLINPSAGQLLELDASVALGKSAAELGLADLLAAPATTHVTTAIKGRAGRWQVTHGTFRDEGISQHLLIIADVHRVLREEERSAWQRLIRVMGHEINNSLAPIKSIADTLRGLLAEVLPKDAAAREDVLPALQIIGERAATLQRFLAQYGRLARLPAPRRRWVRLFPLLTRVAALQHRRGVELIAPEEMEVYVDEDQIEQALINLARNAAEAQEAHEGRITIAAQSRNAVLIITVTDDGCGIANPGNLFVPFFTTKPGGSGTGLLLSQQIAEAHEGTLSLANRLDGRGAIATLHLPGAVRRAS